MKFFGAFLCFFLLVITSGTVSYIYLMWTNYWIRVKAIESAYLLQRSQKVSGSLERGILHRKPRYELEVATEPLSPPHPPEVKAPRQRYNNGPDTMLNISQLPQDKLLSHLRTYKEQIYFQLRSTVEETGKQVRGDSFPNAYNVSYSGRMADATRPVRSPAQILCDARKQISLHTFTKGHPLFRRLKLDRFFPHDEFLSNRYFNTCAVVTSAGSLKHSRLGAFIDSHDIVLRFNDAPTEGYAEDVGKKTTIRVVNSQVVAKPQFKFLESRIYSEAAVVVWDPSGYMATVEQWYTRPDWPFFEQFFSKRLMQPEDSLYLLNPESMWSIWNWLQSVTEWPLLPTPPSSGFLGMMLLLDHCKQLHVMEYIPSMRLTKRCHYYDEEENLGCTLGDWHPLSAEKLVALAMHTGSDIELFSQGYLTIPGFSSCQEESED